MKILHVSRNSNGIEEVKLLANRIHKNNSLAAIEKNGGVFYTGGYLFNDTPAIRKIFEAIPNDEHYKFAQTLKDDPWAKSYYNEEKVKEQEKEEYERKYGK
jgi:hypothetical protein